MCLGEHIIDKQFLRLNRVKAGWQWLADVAGLLLLTHFVWNDADANVRLYIAATFAAVWCCHCCYCTARDICVTKIGAKIEALILLQRQEQIIKIKSIDFFFTSKAFPFIQTTWTEKKTMKKMSKIIISYKFNIIGCFPYPHWIWFKSYENNLKREYSAAKVGLCYEDVTYLDYNKKAFQYWECFNPFATSVSL